MSIADFARGFFLFVMILGTVPPAKAAGEILADDFETGGPWAWTRAVGFSIDLDCEPPDPDQILVGSPITLDGEGFLAGPVEAVGEPAIQVNGLDAPLLSFTPDQIVVSSPSTPTSGPVTVTISNPFFDQTAECGPLTIEPALTIQPIGDKTAPLGQELSFDVVATDFDGDLLPASVSPLPLPLGASFDGHTFTFSPGSGQVGAFPLTFTASDGTSVASETITVTVPEPAASTTLSGVVLTSGSAPLPGVRLVLGTGTTVETFSQADGSFLLAGISQAGQQRLLIDGSTVAGVPQGTYATVPETITIVEGGANVLQAPIYLLPLDLENADPVNPEQTSVIDSGMIETEGQMHPAVEMTVESNSATEDATQEPFSGMVSITQVPSPDLGPMPLPEEFDLAVYIAVQPFGVRYDPPADIAFPNVEGFPVGSVVDIMALNHDTGQMETVGQGIVEFDGMIRSGTLRDDGTFERHGVVRENSWHGFTPQPPDGEGDSGTSGDGGGGPEPCETGSEGCPRTGDLSVAHDLVGYPSLGAFRSFRLAYHSQHAFPHPVVSRLWTPGNLTPAPIWMSTRLELGGVVVGPETYFQGPPCSGFSCPQARFPYAANATSFATGVYPAALRLSCQFQISRRDTTYTQNVQVINQIGSPFGAGWSLLGLERIHRAATGDLLLSDGETEGLVFTPAQRASAEIVQPGERDLYQIVGERGQSISLRMKRRSTEADGSSTLDPTLELRDSRGFLLVSDDESGHSTVAGPGNDAEILAFTLPATDTYTVVARGAGGTVGPYHLFLTTTSETPFGSQASIPDEVDPAFVFSGEIASLGATEDHTFAASAGTRVTLELLRLANQPDGSGSLDPRLELRDSRGILLHADNDSGSNLPPGPGRNALIPSVTLPATDTYTVTTAGSGGSTGPYELRIIFGDLPAPVDVANGGEVHLDNVVLSPAGEFSTLRANADGTFTREMGEGTVKSYDALGRLIALADPNGNTTTFEYDTAGRLATITDPVGLATDFVYLSTGGCPGRLSEIRDPMARVTRFQHDDRCNLVGIVDPDGAERRFEYDGDHLLVRQISPRGIAEGRPDDFATTYAYDFSGRFVRSTLPGGASRELRSDQSMGLVEPPAQCGETSPDLGCPQNLASAVDRSELEVVFVDAEDRQIRRTGIDSLGQAGVLTSPVGLSTTIDRDANGNITRLLHPANHAIAAEYDDRGNLTRVFDEVFGGENLMTYSAELDRLTSFTDADGHTTTYEYDAAGNLSRQSSPRGRVATYTYTPRGQLETVNDPSGRATTYTYDPEGRVRELRVAGGSLERLSSLEYDENGRVSAIVDPLLDRTSFRYDAAGRLVEQTYPDGRSVTLDYDAEGRLRSLTPPGSETHYFLYDERGRNVEYEPPATSATDPATFFVFNRESQLRSVARPDGTSLDFTYDGAGRLSAIDLPRGQVGLTYDPSTGLLTRLEDFSGDAIVLGYRGTFPVSTTWSGRVNGTVAWDYGADRQLVEESVNGAATVEYAYDEDGLLLQAGAAAYERAAADGLHTETEVGTVRTDFTYDALAQRISQTTAHQGSEIYSSTLTRDAAGRIVSRTESLEGSSPTMLSYSYDESGRLVTVRRGAVVEESYSYDANGNRLSATLPDGTFTGIYDEQDRLLQYGTTSFTYTLAGELATKTDTATGAVTTYDYDVRGALRGVIRPDATTIDYVIDAANRRVGKIVDGSLVQGFLYGESSRVIAELDGAGQLVSRFVYGSKLHVPDYMVKNGVTYRILTDPVGSPRLVVDAATGAIAQRLDYDAFGRVLLDTSPGFQPFGFAGGLYDPDTGLVRFGARDYDPEVGRWTAKDPLNFAASDPNLYGYVFNDPVNLIDPDGQLVFLAPVAGAAIGAVTGGAISAISQVINNGGFDNFNWGSVGRAAAFGALGGAAAPFLGFGGAVAANSALSAAETAIDIALDPCVDPPFANAAAAVGVSALGGALNGLIGGPPGTRLPPDASRSLASNLLNEVRDQFSSAEDWWKLTAQTQTSLFLGFANSKITNPQSD